MQGNVALDRPLVWVAIWREPFQGKLGASMGAQRLCLLTTVGRVSGKSPTTPLVAFPHQDGALVVVASNGGSDRPPSWYGNLRANPRVEVQLRPRVTPMVARTATCSRQPVGSPRDVVRQVGRRRRDPHVTLDQPAARRAASTAAGGRSSTKVKSCDWASRTWSGRVLVTTKNGGPAS
jgi:deazaflavin-dependent oxidoreductase (nitroreductase family)